MDENELTILSNYTKGPFTNRIKEVEDDIKKALREIKNKTTLWTHYGILPPSEWDKNRDENLGPFFHTGIVREKIKMFNEGPYYVIECNLVEEVVKLNENVAESDIEIGMRIVFGGEYDEILMPLPPATDPIIHNMEVDEKPNVTYSDVGGCDHQIDLLKEMIEMPMLHPEKYEEFGRLDRKIHFGVPGIEGRKKIFKIHTKTMSLDRGIRFDFLARLCPNSTGADIRSVCTEAGILALRARKRSVSENDFLNAINKVILGYLKFSATPQYMEYN